MLQHTDDHLLVHEVVVEAEQIVWYDLVEDEEVEMDEQSLYTQILSHEREL